MNFKKTIIWTLVTAALLGGACYAVYNTFEEEYSGETTRVFIPAGSTAQAVTDSLTSSLGNYGRKVARLWNLQNGSPETAHGSYVVENGTRSSSLSRRLVQGRQSPMRFTFNNLRTFNALASCAGAKFEFDSTMFSAAADTILPSIGFARPEFAAAFLPDTYEFYWTSTPSQVIQRLTRERDSFWNSDRLAKAQALGLSPVEIATIASIVEEETNSREERPTVARLYLNRLERQMPLQADPTVKFAVGDFSLRRITAEHLRVQSPYNTYSVKGLPPGPIRIPERATIDAVLDAPAHNYLYMCAKSDFSGRHDFAETYDRHRINAARYHRALAARGL